MALIPMDFSPLRNRDGLALNALGFGFARAPDQSGWIKRRRVTSWFRAREAPRRFAKLALLSFSGRPACRLGGCSSSPNTPNDRLCGAWREPILFIEHHLTWGDRAELFSFKKLSGQALRISNSRSR